MTFKLTQQQIDLLGSLIREDFDNASDDRCESLIDLADGLGLSILADEMRSDLESYNENQSVMGEQVWQREELNAPVELRYR